MAKLASSDTLFISFWHRLPRYLLALAIVGIATLLRLGIDPLIHDQVPYFVYVAAVVIATWFTGIDGGVFKYRRLGIRGELPLCSAAL